MPTGALQKAAIVISSLDEEAADRLLDGMPEELASQIRMLSLEVDDIPAAERQAVLDEFLQNSGRKVASPPPAMADELELSDSVHFERTYEPAPAAKPPEPPPFAFLNTAPSEMLGPFFEQEHPQVTAVVLSYLEPARAAEILRQLTPALQADVIDRITELGQPDERIVLEISQRIEQIVSEKTQTFARRRMGLTAAQAILKASSGEQATQLRDELKRRGSWVSSQLEQLEQLGKLHLTEPKPEPVASVAAEVPPPEPKAVEPVPAEQPAAPPQAEVAPVVEPPPVAEVEPKIAFDDLALLDDPTLAQVLRQAGPRVVLIALAGASPRVMKRIAQGLGSREQKGLQQKIRGLQPLLLSDIETAQRMMRRIVEEIRANPTATGGRLQVAA